MPRSSTDQLVSLQLNTSQFLSLQLNACFETLAELTTKLVDTPIGICDPTTLERGTGGITSGGRSLLQRFVGLPQSFVGCSVS